MNAVFQHHIEKKIFHVEIVIPKQSTETLEEDMAKFADKYNKVLNAGHVICLTDNPMGNLCFQATEVIPELNLPVKPEQLMLHLNSFHTREHLDEILAKAAELGIKYILVVTGDGNERLAKLSPDAIGVSANTVTSVELMKHINKEYPDKFSLGVAFNPYEPQDHEMEKMKRKVDAGARYIITQPVFGLDERVLKVKAETGLPVIVEAWMLKKLNMVSQCVGYDIPINPSYDPMANLKELIRLYPDCGFYLAVLGIKTQFPLAIELLK